MVSLSFLRDLKLDVFYSPPRAQHLSFPKTFPLRDEALHKKLQSHSASGVYFSTVYPQDEECVTPHSFR